VPLAIHHSPFCFTFAFFTDASTPPVLDPSQLEQRLSAGLVSIALNAQKEICVLQKLGGVPLGADDIVRLVEIVVVKAREMHNLVETRLQQDWAGRNIEIR
jgi:exosome complex component RRP45